MKTARPPPTLRRHLFLRIVAGGGLILLGVLISDAPTMIVSTRWPTSEGSIIRSSLLATSVRGWEGEYYRSEPKAFISFQYSVNGILYSSADVNSIRSPFHLYPPGYVSRYPVGMDVLVHYNPSDPSEAVLEPGFVDVFQAFDVFSHLLFVAGLYVTYLGVSRIRRQTSQRSGGSADHLPSRAA